METGYDIIFFWVARMMMLGHRADRATTPFHTISLSGLIRDPHGQKMSKTKGNVVDPLAVMDESGRRRAPVRPDPRRDARARTSGSGRRSSRTPGTSRTSSGTRPGSCSAPGRRRSPRDAARPAPSTTRSSARPSAGSGRARRRRRRRSTAAFAEYQFAEVTRALYDGIWSEFCDWGLELAKVRLADDVAARRRARAATWWTLVEALDTYLRLLHPVMPFVTEAIWGCAAAHAPTTRTC